LDADEHGFRGWKKYLSVSSAEIRVPLVWSMAKYPAFLLQAKFLILPVAKQLWLTSNRED
jgi:hypothetical protein